MSGARPPPPERRDRPLIDHANQTFGALHVFDRLPEARGFYRVHWDCCDEDAVMAAGVAGRYAKQTPPPSHCKDCIVIAQAERARLAREAAAKPQQRPDGIVTKGWGWSPFINGPMGPRGSGYGPPSNVSKGA